jgi:hypothetical protein
MRLPFWGLDSDRERREASAAEGRKPGGGSPVLAGREATERRGYPVCGRQTEGPQGRNPEAPECGVGSAFSRTYGGRCGRDTFVRKHRQGHGHFGEHANCRGATSHEARTARVTDTAGLYRTDSSNSPDEKRPTMRRGRSPASATMRSRSQLPAILGENGTAPK